MNAKQRQLRLQDYLEHMLEASRLAQQYLAGIDKAEFFASRMIQQAVLMNIDERIPLPSPAGSLANP